VHNPDTDDSISPDTQRHIVARLQRHQGETMTSEAERRETLLQCFDRILLDHEKLHHGADVQPI
jgi:hypothetical protein